MGILNCTPDSFYDGGRYADPDAAVERGLAMVDEGAAILDIGGESTRPGAGPVPADEETARVVPVIEGLRGRTEVPISIDTRTTAVAEAALCAGADIVNDVSALRDAGMAGLLARTGAGVVLMHMRGTPGTMQQDPVYDDVVGEVRDYLRERASAAEAAGVPRERILLDPGFGFGKTLAHNAALLEGLGALAELGYPVLVGLSRKSMMQTALDLPKEERLEAGLACAVMAVERGAAVVRTHDVRATVRAVGMAWAVLTRSGRAA
jgi:dihydropteroate synthase